MNESNILDILAPRFSMRDKARIIAELKTDVGTSRVYTQQPKRSRNKAVNSVAE